MNPLKLKIKYSKSFEVKRIHNTLLDYAWFKEQGYKINLPTPIKQKLDRDKVVSWRYIKINVTKSFNKGYYKKQAELLNRKWLKMRDNFLNNLETLGFPVPSFYQVDLTLYGSGGSYYLPNAVILNLKYDSKKELIYTLAHEIIHLGIEGWIQKHKIAHWDKEWLVDMAMGRFFPKHPRIQQDPKNKSKYLKIFNRHFPDMEKVIKNIGNL
jgi:hypothetical protein